MSVSIERGYDFRITQTGVELRADGSTATWSLPSLIATLNDGSEHFLVADFQNEGGGIWRLRTSVDGAPFADQGTASGPATLAADTGPSISLDGVTDGAWIDEAAMWANHDEFTDEQLANLHSLGNTYGRPLSEYSEQFPARASSVGVQAEWVAPNRRAGAVGVQAEWVAPNRRAGAVGTMVDFHTELLPGTNLLTNPAAETGDTSGWTSSQSEIGDDPFTVEGTDPEPYEGGFCFAAGDTSGGAGATKTLHQEVDLVSAGFDASTLDASPMIGFGGWQYSLEGEDTGRIELEFLDGPGGAVIGTSGGGDLSPIGWTEQRHVVRVPTGTRAVRFGFTSTKVYPLGSGMDSYLDAAYVILDATTTTAPPTTTTAPPTTTTARRPRRPHRRPRRPHRRPRRPHRLLCRTRQTPTWTSPCPVRTCYHTPTRTSRTTAASSRAYHRKTELRMSCGPRGYSSTALLTSTKTSAPPHQ